MWVPTMRIGLVRSVSFVDPICSNQYLFKSKKDCERAKITREKIPNSGDSLWFAHVVQDGVYCVGRNEKPMSGMEHCLSAKIPDVELYPRIFG